MRQLPAGAALLRRQAFAGWAAPRGAAGFASSSDSEGPFGRPPPSADRRVVVTGLGLLSPLGLSVEESWAALLAGRSGVRRLRAEDFPEGQGEMAADMPSQVVACIDRARYRHQLEAEGLQDLRRVAPFTSYALAAAAEALADADWMPLPQSARETTGVAIGSGMSGTADVLEAGNLMEAGRLRRVSPFFVPRILPNMAGGAVSIQYGLHGPNHAASTACASGAHGIGDAFQLVRRGAADVMLAGGTEAAVDAVAMGGFSRLKALSTGYNDNPAAASRPFDAGRDGFVLGEGAAVLVLEELEHARARGVPMYAEVRGYGLSGDAHHITSPHPMGIGATLAMRRALEQSGVPPEAVCYVNAHATSTPVGDDIEQRAIASVFGARAEAADGGLAVSSTKGATGHLLGAAGAAEAVFTILALHHRVAPPTLNLDNPSPALLGNLVPREAQPLPDGPRAVLSNSFGFGGTNAALLFCSPPC